METVEAFMMISKQQGAEMLNFLNLAGQPSISNHPSFAFHLATLMRTTVAVRSHQGDAEQPD
jgi:hypothetical protein